jgi:hypothetical protein
MCFNINKDLRTTAEWAVKMNKGTGVWESTGHILGKQIIEASSKYITDSVSKNRSNNDKAEREAQYFSFNLQQLKFCRVRSTALHGLQMAHRGK